MINYKSIDNIEENKKLIEKSFSWRNSNMIEPSINY